MMPLAAAVALLRQAVRAAGWKAAQLTASARQEQQQHQQRQMAAEGAGGFRQPQLKAAVVALRLLHQPTEAEEGAATLTAAAYCHRHHLQQLQLTPQQVIQAQVALPLQALVVAAVEVTRALTSVAAVTC